MRRVACTQPFHSYFTCACKHEVREGKRDRCATLLERQRIESTFPDSDYTAKI